MSTMKTMLSALALMGLIAVGVMAQTPPAKPAKPAPPADGDQMMMTTKKQTATKPATTAKSTAPKSDADIEAAIKARLAKAPTLKSEAISVAVKDGVATFTGSVKKSGSKGGVVSLAKAAGAKSVVNNLTVEQTAKTTAAKPAAPAATKPAATPKPKM